MGIEGYNDGYVADCGLDSQYPDDAFCLVREGLFDVDRDGVLHDNCMLIPNGVKCGTCAMTASGVVVGSGVPCNDSSDCDAGQYCQMEQEDFNVNGIGDACECYADCTCDRKIDLADLAGMKGEFFRSNCDVTSCQADCNDDTTVNLADLTIMKLQFMRDDCPIVP